MKNDVNVFVSKQKELSMAKKEYRLPNDLPCTCRGGSEVITDKDASDTTLAYLLTDVVYQLMFSLCERFQSHGIDLRHVTKRRFNEMFKAAKDFRDKSMRLSQDIELLQDSDSCYDAYFCDSEWLYEVIMLLYQKAKFNDENKLRIRSFLFNLQNDKR